MFMVYWLTQGCRAVRAQAKQPETEKSAYKGPGIEKRIPLRICRLIFSEFSTNQERCRIFRTCRTFQADLSANGFAVMPAKCQEILIKNAPPVVDLRSGALMLREGAPLPFSCFSYDPRTQSLLTGDISDHSYNAGVKIWDRKGKLVSTLGRLDKSALAVRLDTQNNRAYCASDAGEVRIWDIKTGENLFNERVSGVHLNVVCSSTEKRSFIHGSESGDLTLVEPDSSGKYQKRQFSDKCDGPVSWIQDAPGLDLVFACSMRSDLEIWNRHTGKKIVTRNKYDTVGYGPEEMRWDAPSERLFVCAGKREIRVFPCHERDSFSIEEGLEKDESARITALHYDATKQWVFAGFNYTEQRRVWPKSGVFRWMRTELVEEPKAGLAVWDYGTKKRLYKIAMPINIRQIDFDPKTSTVLTLAERSVQLWDLGSGRQIRQFAGAHPNFVWDRENRRIVLFERCRGIKEQVPEGGTLSILDYSDVTPAKEKPESKQESKKE